jgi:hypothetical protein
MGKSLAQILGKRDHFCANHYVMGNKDIHVRGKCSIVCTLLTIDGNCMLLFVFEQKWGTIAALHASIASRMISYP